MVGTFESGWFWLEPPTSGSFLYSQGRFDRIEVPGATQGTVARDINDTGQVTGYFTDGGGTHGFVATPRITVLDDFAEDVGKLGPRWNGAVGPRNYRVVGQSLSVREGGPAYWQPNPFGLDQEGFISFSQVDSTGGEQGVLLKSQGEDSDEPHGLIVVKYLAA